MERLRRIAGIEKGHTSGMDANSDDIDADEYIESLFRFSETTSAKSGYRQKFLKFMPLEQMASSSIYSTYSDFGRNADKSAL